MIYSKDKHNVLHAVPQYFFFILQPPTVLSILEEEKNPNSNWDAKERLI